MGRPADHGSSHLGAGQYYGEVLRRGGAPGLLLTELRHPGARALPEHIHAAPFFCLLLDGAYSENVEGRALAYQPFTVGFHPSGLAHSDEIGVVGGHFFAIEVSGTWLAGPDAGLETALPDHVELHGGRMSALATRLYGAWKGGRVEGMSIEELVLDLVAVAARMAFPPERARPRWLRECFEILHAELASPLTVAALAPRLGVHPVHLAREFRRRNGQTMGEYLHLLRVRQACEQLRQGEGSLADIALDAGFADQSHLCRVFKRWVGCSPGQFRAMHGPTRSHPPPTH